MVPATPPPGRAYERVRARKRRPRRCVFPGASWRLPSVDASRVLPALALVLPACGDTPAAGWVGPLVLALSVFGLCLRPVRAAQPRVGHYPATPELLDDGDGRFWHVLS